MGNPCAVGGAKVACACVGDKEHVQTQVNDKENGEYELVWRSRKSGDVDVLVTIDGEPIMGAPFTMRLAPDGPAMAKTSCSGEGLKSTTAGIRAIVNLQLLDQYENLTAATPSLQFGLCLCRADEKKEEKAKWRDPQRPSYAFEGAPLTTGYQISYTPQQAGEMELHLWSVETTTSANGAAVAGAREALPGSPFSVLCGTGEAHAAGSFIDGFSKSELILDAKSQSKKQVMERQATTSVSVDAARQQREQREKQLFESGSGMGAGEVLVIKPSIQDQFGNPATAKEGQLQIELVVPDGHAQSLAAITHVKGGLTTYEARYEPKAQGEYFVNITVGGTAIQRSPLRFNVLAGFPDVGKSRLVMPEQPYFSNQPYELRLITFDKYGNECSTGGAYVSGRISSHSLPAGQETDVEVEDLNNGTYVLRLTLRAPAECKVIVSISREKPNPTAATMPGTVHELPPIMMTFVSLKAIQMKEEREAKKAASLEAFTEGSKGKLRGAVADVVADGRNEKRRSAAPAPALLADGKTFGGAEAAAEVVLSALGDAAAERRATGQSRLGSDLLGPADALFGVVQANKLGDMASMASRLDTDNARTNDSRQTTERPSRQSSERPSSRPSNASGSSRGTSRRNSNPAVGLAAGTAAGAPAPAASPASRTKAGAPSPAAVALQGKRLPIDEERPADAGEVPAAAPAATSSQRRGGAGAGKSQLQRVAEERSVSKAA